MTPKDIQTRINTVYREAIVTLLQDNDEPLDNVQMNDLILGGSTEAQIGGEPEPFAAALLQVVMSGDVLALQVPHEDSYRVVHKLAIRGTEIEKAESAINVANNGPDVSFDANDPTTWPNTTPTLELLEEMNARRNAQRSGLQEMIAGIAHQITESRDDSDQTVH